MLLTGTIVLVPGFWLGGWAWAEVTPRLRAAGHDVYPVTLTGLAERAAEADPRVNVDTHTGIEMHHLPTGHWPMFSRPADLAGLLATLAGPDHAQ